MNQKQAERLLTLAWFLRSVPPEHFDLRTYAHQHKRRATWEIGSRLDVLAATTECGTTACALGWATVLFPDKLQLRVMEDCCGEPDPALYVDGIWSAYCKEAVCDYFGLTELEACSAFGPDNCRTPREEAAFLEEIALNYGWEYV